MEVNAVAVIGAGVIGSGVAQCLAMAGIRTFLIDRDRECLNSFEKQLNDQLKYYRLASTRKPRFSTEEIARFISVYTELDVLAEVDFVIENITESWPLKSTLYPQVDQHLAPHVVIAANTSAIPIEKLAGCTQRPDKVIGIHFMNPVPLKETVELICSRVTSLSTLAITETLLTRMGKRWLSVGDAPGFVSNRILMLTINEAILTLQAGVADAATIDQLFRDCFGHRMGPLQVADLIGLDTIRNTLIVLQQEYQDEKFRPAELLENHVEKEHLGRKTGQGFYQYGLTRT